VLLLLLLVVFLLSSRSAGANATDQVLQWNVQNTTAVQPVPTAPVGK
jgi:hypothetical protein